jgi:hypothetical protein
MVNAWAERERSFFESPEILMLFSEQLAVDVYSRRAERGSESVPEEELEPLAKQYGLELRRWQLTGRSLLNRFADGRYKFSHRSIMEFLFVRRFFTQSSTFPRIAWTDQMKRFLMEIIRHNYLRRIDMTTVCFENGDLEGWQLLGWRGVEEGTSYRDLVQQYGIPPPVGRSYTIGVAKNAVSPRL